MIFIHLLRFILIFTLHGLCESFLDANSFAEAEFRRSKRQINNNIDLSSLCSVGCIASFGNSIDSELENMQQASGTINPQLFDSAKSDKFCGAYRESKACTGGCTDSRLKRLLLAGLSPLDYLCVDHYAEFKSLTPCFKDSLGEVMRVCDTQCGGVSAVSDLRDEAKAAQESKDFKAMTRIMSQLCDLLRCRVECEKPILERVCRSKEPGYFMQDFAIVSMKGTENMLKEAGAQEFFPPACRSLSDELNSQAASTDSPSITSNKKSTTRTRNSATSLFVSTLMILIPISLLLL